MRAMDRMGIGPSLCRKCGLVHGPVVYFTVDAPASVIPPAALDPYWNSLEGTLSIAAGTTDWTKWRIHDAMYGYEDHIVYAIQAYPVARRHLAQTYGNPAAARLRLGEGRLDLWQHEQRTICGFDVDLDDVISAIVPEGGITVGDFISAAQYGAVDPNTGLSLEDWVKATSRILFANEFLPQVEADIKSEVAAAEAASPDADMTAKDVLAIVASSFTVASQRLAPPAPFPGAVISGMAKDGTMVFWWDTTAKKNRAFSVDGVTEYPMPPA
jgi:hypothetical protein